MFTSGTTAAPKGVAVTQANYAFAGDVMAAAAALHPDHRWLVVLPLFHANAQYYSFASAISAGASVALVARFSAGGFVQQARRHQATHASLFAAPIRMILARTSPGTEPLALSHCWFAQDLAEREYKAFARLAGCRPRQLYGMTETAPAVLSAAAVEPLADSIGQPTVGCDVRLVVPDRNEEPAEGQVGEIVVGGRAAASYSPATWTTPTPPRPASGTARSSPVTWPCATPRGASASPGAAATYSRSRARTCRPWRSRGSWLLTPAVLDCAVVGERDELRDEVPVAHVVRAGGPRGARGGEAGQLVRAVPRAVEGAAARRLPRRVAADLGGEDPEVRAVRFVTARQPDREFVDLSRARS